MGHVVGWLSHEAAGPLSGQQALVRTARKSPNDVSFQPYEWPWGNLTGSDIITLTGVLFGSSGLSTQVPLGPSVGLSQSSWHLQACLEHVLGPATSTASCATPRNLLALSGLSFFVRAFKGLYPKMSKTVTSFLQTLDFHFIQMSSSLRQCCPVEKMSAP